MNAGITFYYQVAARNSCGLGLYSLDTSGTTLSSAVPPSAPTLNDFQVGTTKLTSNWTAGGNGGYPILKYNVIISSGGAGGDFQDASGSPVKNTTKLTISGLQSSTPYWVKVNEVTKEGSSVWSIPKEISTSSAQGNCDGCCTGTAIEWNGSFSTSHPIPAQHIKLLNQKHSVLKSSGIHLD